MLKQAAVFSALFCISVSSFADSIQETDLGYELTGNVGGVVEELFDYMLRACKSKNMHPCKINEKNARLIFEKTDMKYERIGHGSSASYRVTFQSFGTEHFYQQDSVTLLEGRYYPQLLLNLLVVAGAHVTQSRPGFIETVTTPLGIHCHVPSSNRYVCAFPGLALN